MSDIRDGWKVFLPDYRSPIQGSSSAVWTGRLPFELPAVALDTGPQDCAAGWNYCEDIWTAVRIAGLWPIGRPNHIVAVLAGSDAIQRSDKRRASTVTLLRHATDEEIGRALGRPFGVHAATMAREQLAWRQALSRPKHDPAEVEALLVLALSARGLAAWDLRKYDSAWAAWAARAAGAAWAAWAAWDARAAWAAWDARAAWDAWAARAAWDARAAGAAGAALSIYYSRLMAWMDGEPDQYTTGLRDAYANGLAIAIPVAKNTLGWAMGNTS